MLCGSLTLVIANSDLVSAIFLHALVALTLMFLATGCHISDGTLARLGAAVEAAIPAGPIILVAPVNAGDDLVAGERLAVIDRMSISR